MIKAEIRKKDGGHLIIEGSEEKVKNDSENSDRRT
jgi:hypothetical protein